MTRSILAFLLWAPVAWAADPPVAEQPVEAAGELSAARTLLEGGDAQAVVARLEALLARQPDQREARLLLGHAYLALKKYQHALNVFSSVLLEDPEVAAAASGRALALVGLGDVPKATTWASKATELAPDDLAAWAVLGQVYLTDSYLDAPRAEATFRQMLVMDPNHRQARLQLARALSYQKKVEDAIGLLEALAAEQPDDFAVRIKLAESYYAVRKLSRAEELLTKVLAVRPDHPEALRLLEAVQDRQAYLIWVPVSVAVLVPLLYLLLRRLKRGRRIEA